MKYALVDTFTSKVVNFAIWDGITEWPVPYARFLVRETDVVDIGYTLVVTEEDYEFVLSEEE